MKRFALSSFTFAMLSIGYALYARVVVPHIEPTLPPLSARHHPPANADGTIGAPGSGGPQKARDLARRAFGPEAPEVNAPFVWQFSSGPTTVYFFTDDYREAADSGHAAELQGGSNRSVQRTETMRDVLELEPLSMVVHQVTADGQETVSLTTLRCPRARLEFDKLDMQRLQAGKPVGGLLERAIEIRHLRTGDEEPWILHTRDVRFLGASETSGEAPPRLTTEAPVEFSHGQDQGGGNGLDILLTASPEQLKAGGGLAVNGIASLSIRRNVRFVMQVDPKAASFGQLAGQAERRVSETGDEPVPLEIRCSGPFQYNFETQAALFRNAVEVLHQVSAGAPERLQCEQLDLFLARNTEAASQGRADTESPSALTFRELRAAGKPVLIDSPENQLHVLATFLSYDAQQGETVLANDEGPVLIVDAYGEIHAGRLTIQQDKQGEVASVHAEGAGKMWRRDEGSDQQLRAHWSRQLRIERDEQLYVLRLRGRAGMRATAQGSLEAEQIDIWLRPKARDAAGPSATTEKAEAAGANDIAGMEPVALQSAGAVQIDAPQLSGNYERLELQFQDAEAPAEGAAPGPATGPTPSPQRSSRGPQQALAQGGKLNIDARRLRVHFLRGAGETRVHQAWAEGNIDARQEDVADGEAAGLLLQGETLSLQDVGEEQELRLTGAPAEVRSQEMVLRGNAIELRRAANRLDVYGGGVLMLAVDRDFDGQALASRKELEIRWVGGLVFDGAAAVFREGVEARLDATRLVCHRMDVILEQAISFIDPPDDARGTARIRRLVCHADPAQPDSTVELIKEVRQKGKLVEYQHNVSAHIVFDSATGDVRTKGPGTLVSVAPGDDPGVGLGLDPPRAAAQQPATAEPGLKRLEIRYAQHMSGNLKRNHATFRDRVEVVYGPVESAEQRLDPHRLPKGGMWMRSNLLEVTQEEVPGGPGSLLQTSRSGSPVLLTATGNVQADVYENSLYSAQAHRMSYSEAWDRLIIEGRGSIQARLWRQTRAGGMRDPFTGDRITFHPRKQLLKVDGATVIAGSP